MGFCRQGTPHFEDYKTSEKMKKDAKKKEKPTALSVGPDLEENSDEQASRTHHINRKTHRGLRKRASGEPDTDLLQAA